LGMLFGYFCEVIIRPHAHSFKGSINQTGVIGKNTELAKLNIGPQPQLTVLVVIPINAFFERYHVSVCR